MTAKVDKPYQRRLLRSLANYAGIARAGWVDRAACGGHDPELWFPVRSNNPIKMLAYVRADEQARAICKTCPVSQQCLEHALGRNEDGIWGGLDQEERRKLKRKRANW